MLLWIREQYEKYGNSTEQSLSFLLTPWCRVLLAASQVIPRISRNPKVHYRTHKRQPPVSILGQPNPVHIPTSHLLEIHSNIIQPSTATSPQWSPSLRLPHQDPIHSPLLTHTRHMPNPSHLLYVGLTVTPTFPESIRTQANILYAKVWRIIYHIRDSDLSHKLTLCQYIPHKCTAQYKS